MRKYILMRLLTLVPILLGVSFLVFSLFWIIPGDAVDIMIGDQSFGNPAARDALRHSLNLDRPFYVQYGMWLWKAVQGDLGTSVISGQKVTGEILSRFPVNLQLMAVALFFVVAVGIPVGLLSAYRQFSYIDHLVRFVTTLGYSIPNFWAATLIVLAASLYLRWLPVLDYVPFSENPLASLRSTLIPGFVLGLSAVSYIVRMTRSSVLDTLRQDYVRTARAKGMTERVVLLVHVLKNSLIPVVTVLGVQVGIMIGGFVLTEEVFVLPGVGRLLLMAIQQRDFMIVTGTILFMAAFFVVINLIVDILYSFLDPRIRY
jgi:peptide/nickel transport system permease protein